MKFVSGPPHTIASMIKRQKRPTARTARLQSILIKSPVNSSGTGLNITILPLLTKFRTRSLRITNSSSHKHSIIGSRRELSGIASRRKRKFRRCFWRTRARRWRWRNVVVIVMMLLDYTQSRNEPDTTLSLRFTQILDPFSIGVLVSQAVVCQWHHWFCDTLQLSGLLGSGLSQFAWLLQSVLGKPPTYLLCANGPYFSGYDAPLCLLTNLRFLYMWVPKEKRELYAVHFVSANTYAIVLCRTSHTTLHKISQIRIHCIFFFFANFRKYSNFLARSIYYEYI